jgi:hypothetical protein
LLSDVLRICEVMGTPHRHHMNANHLRHQHGLDGIPGLDALNFADVSSAWYGLEKPQATRKRQRRASRR